VALDRLSEAEAALLPLDEGLGPVREKGPQAPASRALLLAQVKNKYMTLNQNKTTKII
jgi:hypothetical protein